MCIYILFPVLFHYGLLQDEYEEIYIYIYTHVHIYIYVYNGVILLYTKN